MIIFVLILYSLPVFCYLPAEKDAYNHSARMSHFPNSHYRISNNFPMSNQKCTQHQNVMGHRVVCSFIYLFVPNSFVVSDNCFIVVLIYKKRRHVNKNYEK